jgi:hypothetical protein
VIGQQSILELKTQPSEDVPTWYSFELQLCVTKPPQPVHLQPGGVGQHCMFGVGKKERQPSKDSSTWYSFELHSLIIKLPQPVHLQPGAAVGVAETIKSWAAATRTSTTYKTLLQLYKTITIQNS